MNLFLTIFIIYVIWMIIDFILLIIAGNNDKLIETMENKFAAFTYMLPLTLTTLLIILIIRLKK